MQEVVRAYILRSGLTKVEMVGRRTLEAGEVLEFTERRYFRDQAAGDLTVAPCNCFNEVHLTFEPRPYINEHLEQLRSPEMRWHVFFGLDPSLGTYRTFGRPDPTLRVEFLGHPLRDEVAAIRDAASPGALETSESLPMPGEDSQYQQQKILVAGSRFTDRLQWYDYHHYDPYFKTGQTAIFTGQAMLMAKLQYYPKFSGDMSFSPSIHILMATWAEQDGLLRIRESAYGKGRSLRGFRVSQLKEVAQSLAMVSVGIKDIGLLRKYWLRNEYLLPVGPHSKQLQLNVDLAIDTLNRFIYDPEGSECYGSWQRGKTSEWRDVLLSLPSAEVQEAYERLTHQLRMVLPLS